MHHYAAYTLIIQLTIQEALFKQHLNKFKASIFQENKICLQLPPKPFLNVLV